MGQLEEERLHKGDAEYVAPRIETNQFEEMIELSGTNADMDAIERYFSKRREDEMAAKSAAHAGLVLEDESTEKKVYYMFKERGVKVKLSFINMSDAEALVVVNEVRARVGLSPADSLKKMV